MQTQCTKYEHERNIRSLYILLLHLTRGSMYQESMFSYKRTLNTMEALTMQSYKWRNRSVGWMSDDASRRGQEVIMRSDKRGYTS